jgi:glycosyltransferase involved in cell wall biosynthesis
MDTESFHAREGYLTTGFEATEQGRISPVAQSSQGLAKEIGDTSMIDRLRLLFLLPWKEEGCWDLYREIKSVAKEIQMRHPYGKWPSHRILGKIIKKFGEFLVPLMAVKESRQFDVVLSWSMRIGVVYGLVNRLIKQKGPLHVMRDFHINLERGGVAYRLKNLLLKAAIPGIDFFLCTSTQERFIYSRLFNISPSRLFFYPDFPIASWFDQKPHACRDYVFAYGNSDRDFDTLIRAAALFHAPVLILSQTYVPKTPVPEHVTLIRNFVPLNDLMELIGTCRLMILPLQSYWIAAAQNSMLETMALGRPLIVTANLATLEYATHLKTAFFVEAGDASSLSQAINYLWAHPDEAEAMGQQAREHAQQLVYKKLPFFTSVLNQVMELGRFRQNGF